MGNAIKYIKQQITQSDPNLPENKVNLDEEKKLTEVFILRLFCGVSKSFMKALKAFIKPFEAPQRSAKMTARVNGFEISQQLMNQSV